MTTEDKALALLNEVARERGSTHDSVLLDRAFVENEALCRAIEQHETFRQEVSDAVVEYFGPKDLDVILAGHLLERFIIPKPKPDPLADVAKMMGYFNTAAKHWAGDVRAALDALGFEIREKGQ